LLVHSFLCLYPLLLVQMSHHRLSSPEHKMRPRSRSPVRGRELALVPPWRAMPCPCLPCPWCILQIPHDSLIDDVKQHLRQQMMAWACSGCSTFQVALSVFAFEWILIFLEQRPYGPSQALPQIGVIEGQFVKPFASSVQSFVQQIEVWTRAPPPPPPGLFPGGSSSSSAGSSVANRVAASSVWDTRGSLTEPLDWAPDLADETRETLPEIHPHFQWQAGSSKKTWRSFDELRQTQLRDAYNRDHLGWFRIKWGDQDTPDTLIDFRFMLQKNEETEFERKIRIKLP
jgi:hypothetical protein